MVASPPVLLHSYEEQSGRESVIELLAAVFTKFPEVCSLAPCTVQLKCPLLSPLEDTVQKRSLLLLANGSTTHQRCGPNLQADDYRGHERSSSEGKSPFSMIIALLSSVARWLLTLCFSYSL